MPPTNFTIEHLHYSIEVPLINIRVRSKDGLRQSGRGGVPELPVEFSERPGKLFGVLEGICCKVGIVLCPSQLGDCTVLWEN